MGRSSNFFVRMGADFSAVTTQSKKASSSVVSMMSSINRSTAKLSTAASNIKKLMGAVGIGVSLQGIISGAKEALETYQDQEEAESKLAQVMKNTMAASQEEYQSILDLTAAQQALGVVGDEVQLQGAQELATYLGQTDSLKKLLPVMNDMLAQQYGLNATEENAVNIATMMGKVMNGQTGALSRYGYKFTEAQEAILKYGDEEQRAATLAAVVEESVGGMNEALANTPSGRLQQAKNALGDIKEEFGSAVMTIATVFLPLLQKVAQWLSAIAAFANRVAQSIANVFGKKTQTLSSAAAATGGLATVSDSADTTTEALEGTAAAAKKLTSMKWDELNLLSTSSSSGSSDVIDTETLAGNYTGVDWSSTEEAAESCTALERILQRLQKTTEKMDFSNLKKSWENLKVSAGELGAVIKERLGDVYRNILEPLAVWSINEGAPLLVQTLADVFGALADVLDRLDPLIEIVERAAGYLAKLTADTILSGLAFIAKELKLIGDIISGDWGDALDVLKDMKTRFGELIEKIGKFIGKITPLNSGLSRTLELVGKIISAFNGKKTASEIFGTYTTQQSGGTALGGWNTLNLYSNKSTVSGRAGGGFVGSAELFYANENGVPEYIGRMGGQTAVANREQIAEGISSAVVEAIRGTGLLEVVRNIADSSERTARKDFTLGKPNSTTGRWVSQSLTKYETQRGRA